MVVCGTWNISLCVCFPLGSLEEMPVRGDDQRLSGNLDDGHNLGNWAIFRSITAEPQQDSSPRGGQCGSKHAAQTAPSKPLKAKQKTQSKFLKRLRGAWLRNNGTPAGFKSKGWPMRLQTCCPNGTFETPKSKAKYAEQVPKKASWGVVAKQRNPSRIQVQGVANAAPNMLPKRHRRNP